MPVTALGRYGLEEDGGSCRAGGSTQGRVWSFDLVAAREDLRSRLHDGAGLLKLGC